jgi:hypothetical protein
MENPITFPGEDPATISLSHWLENNFEQHPYHDIFYHWVNKDENAHLSWFEATEKFFLETSRVGYWTQEARDNTCNSENDFEQEFIYEIYMPEHMKGEDWIYCDEAVVVIFAHTGCDVRGGYSSPMILQPKFRNEFCLPLEWVCSYYSEQLTEEENDRLSAGYTGYPFGEIENLGLTFDRMEDGDAIFKRDGEEITISAFNYDV